MILQLVLVVPRSCAAARHGVRGRSSGGLACTIGVLVVRSWLNASWGRFGYIAFAPRLFAHVAFGLVLAPHVARLGTGTAAAALALLVPGVLIADGRLVPALAPFAGRLLELPLAVLLLAVMERLQAIPGLARALSWLGASSYGIYLGQMLVHNGFVFALGLGGMSALNRWLYAALSSRQRARLRRARRGLLRAAGRCRRGVPLPDLAR
jgi:peptidoglycan/LPS O-acetylase OafA/YrhL